MGVFSKSDKRSSTNNATIIPQGTCIIGGINAKGTVVIDGKFEGVILEAEVISIGLTGEVIGDIKADNLIVNGLFDGKIDCDKIQILSKGKVIGEIKYNELEIEKNGQFEGTGIKKNSNLKSRYNDVENKLNKILLAPSTVNYDKS
jgi:cytoskeletal protein CcmA (bactofilin family)